MKIAVILAGFSEGYIYHLYKGFQKFIEEKEAWIDMYTCFGRMGMENVTNQIQYEFLGFPDLHQYDGVILPIITIMEKPVRKVVIQQIRESGIPCVSVEEEIEGFSWVGIDQYTALKEIVIHMIQQHNARSFCYLGGAADTYEANVREKAFRDALNEYHLPIRQDWIFSMNYKYDEGFEAGQKILTAYLQGKEIPDTVISSNDDMATGVCDAFYGTQLQGKVRVTGFDRYSLGENYRPELTTVARPREQVAYESCVLLEKLIQEKTVKAAKRKLDYSLVFAETCGCCKQEERDATEFRRMVFHKNLRNQKLQDRMDSMEERMTGNSDVDEILTECLEVLKENHCRHFKVILREHLLSNNRVSYHDCRDVKMDWYAEDTSEKLADTGKLAGITMYVPLHFQQRIIGYCCLEGIGQFLRCEMMESFFKTVGFSMENYIQKRQYHEINKKYQNLYMTDQLTGLYNRFGMQEYGERFYEKNCCQQKDTLIIFCDINRLKYINDTFGHKMGDWAIKTVGTILGKFQNEACMSFRYGGDEFLLLAEAEKGRNLIPMMKEELKRISMAEGHGFPLEVSMGSITASWEEEGSLEQYFIQADEAMYQEKLRYHAEYAK